MDWGVTGFVLFLLIVGFGAPLWALWCWRGAWRIVPAAGAAFMGFIVLRIVVGVWRDPTSHNLWPLEIIWSGAAVAFVIGVLRVARRFLRVGEEG